MSAAMQKIGAGGPTTRFFFCKLSTADNHPIVRQSPDLLYSSCVFDVSKGPVVIDVEPVLSGYWSVSIFDARTDVAKVLSNQDTGGKAARLVLHHEDMQVEFTPGYENIPLRYNKGIVLSRILLTDPPQFSAIDSIRRKAMLSHGLIIWVLRIRKAMPNSTSPCTRSSAG
jgi:hypothetical protein